MGLFGRKNEVVDLTETVIPQRKRVERTIKQETTKQETQLTSTRSDSSGSVFDFMSGESQTISSNQSEEQLDLPQLQIILKNTKQRVEDQSIEIYRLMHRIELLERKIERIEGRRL